MKNLFFLTLLLLFVNINNLSAQVPDNSYGRLYRLCKTWGFVKYHHPNKCNINWNNILLSRIDSVYNSTSNTEFNNILFNMCTEAGYTSAPTAPVIIMSDSAKNYHIDWFNDPYLSIDVHNYLDSVHAHAIVDTFCGLVDYNDYSDPNYYSLIDFRHDSINNIPSFSYTNLNHRMLVYFYYWNAINYFAPQIDIADNPWDSTLIQLMPEIVQSNTDSAFHLNFSKVVSRIDDSHGFFSSVYSQDFLSNVPYGTVLKTNYLKLARIENKHVIVNSGLSNIHVGDIVMKVNGKDLDSLYTVHSNYIAASNEITKYRNFYSNVFDGAYGDTKTVELIDSMNNTIQTTFTTNISYTQYYNWLDLQDTNSVYKTIDCNGYVHMGKILPSEIPTMYANLKNMPAIIFDIRNYPNGTLWDLKPLLFPSPNISAHFFEPDLSFAGYSYIFDDIDNFGSWSNPNPYNGKVIILVNEETQSQAEYTAQALRTFPNAVIFGSQTAGADGNISWLDLPGSIRTYWSSLGWYQANWYNPQRAGVQIDTIVNRTIVGVRHGIDEVLNRATNCPTSIHEMEPTTFNWTWTKDFIQINSDTNEPYDIQIFNSLGQVILTSHASEQLTRLSIQQFTAGLYIIHIIDHNQKIITKKIIKS